MPATTYPHSSNSISTTTSSKSGNIPMNSIHRAASPCSPSYPAPVTRSGNHNHQGQTASAPASFGRRSGYTIVNSSHLDVTLGATSLNSTPDTNKKHPRPPASKTPTKNAKPATGEKVFDFKYKNIYTTPPMRSGGRMTRGRATIGSGSGAGSGMGACALM